MPTKKGTSVAKLHALLGNAALGSGVAPERSDAVLKALASHLVKSLDMSEGQVAMMGDEKLLATAKKFFQDHLDANPGDRSAIPAKQLDTSKPWLT